MPHWKNYEFEHYEPKNLGDIVQKLDEVGLDLLKVLIILFRKCYSQIHLIEFQLKML